ncbi:bifunctional oligoribonuclease/PAP phosphatase NrnA [Desulfuromonas sp. AOP6]|uniref:DHH family phosphoesterase n=1 Tax=Desulfuromonas sp. AOP6 TaxID=1566351 RepID=UPI00127C58B2|nr:bifunctional oligoribonuclease/PAP phosphatase NrnA [Desulfuromonas sp. AOP6]BCA79521.1 phosphoesterase [Desulfuromonas sp. AOP6]
MIAKISRIIKENNRFLVASHEGPDGDAMASTLALTNALREMGKDVVAYNRDAVPADFTFLPGAETIVQNLDGSGAFDVGFVLDAGELRRAGSHLKECCGTLVNIDHHPFSEDFGSLYFVDESASATGALIYRILKAMGHPISSQVALCVYTAILADTGSFRYSNADPEAFSIAAEMVALGVSPWEVASGLYESQEEKRLRLLGAVLNTLTVSSCGRYASVTATLDMMAQTNTGPEYTDGFINYPRSVRGVEVALFFREVSPDNHKVGFRSKGKVDVGALARELGGGGHHNASGAMVLGAIETVRQSVFARLDSLLF